MEDTLSILLLNTALDCKTVGSFLKISKKGGRKKFNFLSQGPAYKKEGPDPIKGSNQQ